MTNQEKEFLVTRVKKYNEDSKFYNYPVIISAIGFALVSGLAVLCLCGVFEKERTIPLLVLNAFSFIPLIGYIAIKIGLQNRIDELNELLRELDESKDNSKATSKKIKIKIKNK